MEKIILENINKRIIERGPSDVGILLRDINFKVHSGEIFAIAGMRGCGKSSVTKILFGLTYQDSGTFHYDKASTGILIQEQEFYENKTVFQTMVMFAKLNKKHIRSSEIRNTLKAVGLYKRRKMRIKALSINRCARLKIALAIMARPSILILDDPFSAIGPTEARHIRVILKTLSERFGTAVLLTAPDFSGIEEIFDTVAIMDQGRIICIESYNNLAKMTDKDSKICVTTPTPNMAATLIAEKFSYGVNLYGSNEVIVNAHPDKAKEIRDHLVLSNIEVTSMSRVTKSIEGLFHKLRTRNFGEDY